MEHLTYKQAWAYPAKHGGWAHIKKNSDSMQAATARALAGKFCIRPESVYKWALSQTVSLRDSIDRFFDNEDLLFACVLNDWSIDRATNEIKAATP